VPGAETVAMGGTAATLSVLADVITRVQQFIFVFVWIYVILILAYVLLGWVRLPYSAWLNRIQRFLYDVCEPYLRLFRRFLPPLGPLDLSPMVAVIVLWIFEQALNRILDQFH
jgi:YggT family protein